MAKVYANLIKKGLKTIDDVPENLRDEVLALLQQSQKCTEGRLEKPPFCIILYAVNGLHTAKEFEEIIGKKY